MQCKDLKQNHESVMQCKNLKQNHENVTRTGKSSDPTGEDFNKVMKRTEFSRDIDRILFSKSFRRLQHKAQLYSFQEGDHFRNRLTHTLEVVQIAKTLSKALEVDVDLTEAIALGHDIGHTPFGHEGEKVLDHILRGTGLYVGRKPFDKKYKIDYGGFKHNYNSIRILHNVEKRVATYDGLDLTCEVLEGIFKHTSINRKEIETETKYGNWEISRYIDDPELIKRLYLDQPFSVSLEGQIVEIADEIAQRQHDLDDGLRDLSSALSVDELIKEILETINKILLDNRNELENDSEEQNLKECIKYMEKLRKVLSDTIEEPKDDKKDVKYKRNCLQKYIVKYFLMDVSNTTKYNVTVLKATDYEKIEKSPTIIKKKIVSFSKIGEDFNTKLIKIISNKIINSYKINRSNGKAQYILSEIFRAYYGNPLQMKKVFLEEIEKKVKHNLEKCPIKLKYKNIELHELSFEDSSSEEIRILIETIKLDKSIKDNIDTPKGFKDRTFKKRINSKTDLTPLTPFEDCLLKNNYVLISTICYYISGMTDNYARQQYKELYLVD